MDRMKLLRDTEEIMGTKKISAFRASSNWSTSKKAAKKQRVLGPNFCSCFKYARSEFGKALCLHVCARTLATKVERRKPFHLFFFHHSSRSRCTSLISVKYRLLTKLFRSRWLDIGQVPFLEKKNEAIIQPSCPKKLGQ